MTVRYATPQDIETIKDILVEYSKLSPIKALVIDKLDRCDTDVHIHANTVLLEMIHAGVLLLDQREEEITGLLMAYKSKHFFNPRAIMMNLVCWYVKPEHQKGKVAGRLFKAYTKHCDGMMKRGEIHAYTMTKNQYTSSDLDYGKYNLTKLEETYVTNRSL